MSGRRRRGPHPDRRQPLPGAPAWDVVNEAIDNAQPGLRSTVFSRGLGADYVAEAFRLARQADPEAELIYNDYGGEGTYGSATCRATRQ